MVRKQRSCMRIARRQTSGARRQQRWRQRRQLALASGSSEGGKGGIAWRRDARRREHRGGGGQAMRRLKPINIDTASAKTQTAGSKACASVKSVCGAGGAFLYRRAYNAASCNHPQRRRWRHIAAIARRQRRYGGARGSRMSMAWPWWRSKSRRCVAAAAAAAAALWRFERRRRRRRQRGGKRGGVYYGGAWLVTAMLPYEVVTS